MEERKETADFYRWLRERNQAQQIQPQKYARLEIPPPPKYRGTEQISSIPQRGICIIDLG